MIIVDNEEWYGAKEAAERLSQNSGKQIDPAYLRTLARYNKITHRLYGIRDRLYLKSEVDAYVVEKRGDKAHKAYQEKKLGDTNPASNCEGENQ